MSQRGNESCAFDSLLVAVLGEVPSDRELERRRICARNTAAKIRRGEAVDARVLARLSERLDVPTARVAQVLALCVRGRQ